MQPLVCVLMTAYNREKYIAEAIESVLASTYSHFELIIVDDDSKDNTVSIAKSFEARDKRIKVFINESNLGDYPNRNKAASYASGKYIKYVDADDLIYPQGLEILVEGMERFPEAGWGLCSLEQDLSRSFPFLLMPEKAYQYHYLGPGLFHKAPLSAIIKKEVFDTVNGFCNIRMAGDFEMWNRLAQNYPVVAMQQGIVWSRQHNDQEMNSHRQFSRLYEDLKIQFLMQSSCPLDRNSIEIILKKSKLKSKKEMIKGILLLDTSRFKEGFTRFRMHKNVK